MSSLSSHIKKSFLLALPIGIGQMGHVLTGISDYTMLGHYRSLDMASTTFATSVFFPIMILGIGFSIGLTPLVAKANGAHDLSEGKKLFNAGFKVNMLTAFILFLLLLLIAVNLDLFQQDEGVAENGFIYFLIISASIFPIMLFQSCKQYVEALQDTLTPMYFSLASNVLNVGLNYVLIFGKFGFPEMGIIGAGVSTLISRLLMSLVFLWYFTRKKELKHLLKDLLRSTWEMKKVKKILNIGLPISIFMFFEVTAFSAATFMVGWISADHLSAHQIALSLASLSFVFSLGVGSAASIRSATYYGEKNKKGIKKVAQSVMVITIGLSTLSAIFFFLFNEQLPLLFVPAEETLIITQAAGMILFAALFQFSDGLQVVFQGLLQGIGDVKLPSFIAILSYWAIGLPVGYFLAFKYNYGANGVWIGLAVGLTISALLQLVRYRFSLRKLKV